MNGFAIEVMNEIGIDISRHRSKTLKKLRGMCFDLIIALSLKAGHFAEALTS